MAKNKVGEIKEWNVKLDKKALTNIALNVSDDNLLEDRFLELYDSFNTLYTLEPVNEAGNLLPLSELMQRKVLYIVFRDLDYKLS